MDAHGIRARIEQECLSRALELIKKEAVPTAGTIGTAAQLVRIAHEVHQVNGPIDLAIDHATQVLEEIESQKNSLG